MPSTSRHVMQAALALPLLSRMGASSQREFRRLSGVVLIAGPSQKTYRSPQRFRLGDPHLALRCLDVGDLIRVDEVPAVLAPALELPVANLKCDRELGRALRALVMRPPAVAVRVFRGSG